MKCRCFIGCKTLFVYNIDAHYVKNPQCLSSSLVAFLSLVSPLWDGQRKYIFCYQLVSNSNSSLSVFLLCHNSRPRPFYVSLECHKDILWFICHAKQLSGSRKWNNKGENMMAVAASTAGDSNSAKQKHETRLWGIGDGGFAVTTTRFSVMLGHL